MGVREGAVLVIGATGRQGGATARALLERGRPVRALVRDPGAPAMVSLRERGAGLVVGDLDDPASMRAALDGVDGVFLVLTMMAGPKISPTGVVDEQRRGRLVAELARDAGVGHLVYSSLHGAGAGSGIPFYQSKERIEDNIRALGLPATVLRPVSFMDNFATYNRPTLRDGEVVVNLALGAEIPMPLICVRDIGQLAAIVFERRDRFLGRTVEIAGDVLTPVQIAEIFGRVCGRPARFHEVPIEQVRAFDPLLARMFEFFNARLDDHPDVAALRVMHPGLMTLETWLRDTDWTPQPTK